LRDAAYMRYGLPRGRRSTIDASGRRHPAYQIDHLVPLELGGAPDDVRNLWPQPIAEAKVKDRIEDRLHRAVCRGREPLSAAQRAIVADWRRAML
jgi:hypothetical protein